MGHGARAGRQGELTARRLRLRLPTHPGTHSWRGEMPPFPMATNATASGTTRGTCPAIAPPMTPTDWRLLTLLLTMMDTGI